MKALFFLYRARDGYPLEINKTNIESCNGVFPRPPPLSASYEINHVNKAETFLKFKKKSLNTSKVPWGMVMVGVERLHVNNIKYLLD